MKLNISFILLFVFLACIGIRAELLKSQKEHLLELHKKARREVNSPNMKELFWDNNIANSAQRYADECRGMVHGNTPYGENLAGNSSGNLDKMFKQWMNEKEYFEESGYSKLFHSGVYNGFIIGHYSQIVWANNDKFGCGYSYCEGLPYKHLLVCRYKTGNVLNQQVYEKPPITTIDDDLKNAESGAASLFLYPKFITYLIAFTIVLILV